MDILRASAEEIHRRTLSGELDPIETANVFSAAASASQSKINSFITLTPGLARKSGAGVKTRLERQEPPGPLAGVPVAVKDNICLQGYPTTCGSRILASFKSPYNATAVKRLLEAGALIIGKTNLDEFAMGSTNESSCIGPAKNPLNDRYSPGGSSGGSAAAVADYVVPIALGSDTGGSIRQPASLTGNVGFKPTYGAVSRYGLVAYASSFDQIGPLARTVRDAAMLHEVIAGYDHRDSTSIKRNHPSILNTIEKFEPVRIAVPEECFGEGLDDDVRKEVKSALSVAESLGCKLVPVSIPVLQRAVAAYYVIATAEASSNLARYDGSRYGYRASEYSDLQEMYVYSRSEGFGEEVKRRIMLGTYVLSSGYYERYYRKAMQVREIIRRDVLNMLEEVDIIATPTSPTAGIELGEKIGNPLSMYLSDVYTVTANLVGTGAISIPCGRGKDDLPVGLQLMGKPFDDITLFRLARKLESELKIKGIANG